MRKNMQSQIWKYDILVQSFNFEYHKIVLCCCERLWEAILCSDREANAQAVIQNEAFSIIFNELIRFELTKVKITEQSAAYHFLPPARIQMTVELLAVT